MSLLDLFACRRHAFIRLPGEEAFHLSDIIDVHIDIPRQVLLGGLHATMRSTGIAPSPKLIGGFGGLFSNCVNNSRPNAASSLPASCK